MRKSKQPKHRRDETGEAQEHTKKRKRRDPMDIRWCPAGTCDYAYCYYNKKTHENVYQCVKCGKYLYV